MNFSDYAVARIDEAPYPANACIVDSDAPPAGAGRTGRAPPFVPILCKCNLRSDGEARTRTSAEQGELGAFRIGTGSSPNRLDGSKRDTILSNVYFHERPVEASMSASTSSLPHNTEPCATRALLDALFVDYPRRNFHIRMPDGSVWGECRRPRFTLVLKQPGALRELFENPSELSLGEAYIYDEFDIEGDVEAALEVGEYLLNRPRSLREKWELKKLLSGLPTLHHAHAGSRSPGWWGVAHSRSRDRQAIHFHYDLPPEFYALWLDRRMVYSCAYFASPEDDLEAAQQRKLDYISRKLRLRAGEQLLDIGCGWGGLVMHAAAEYGVKALGITLSTPQAELAARRIQEAGLSERCRVQVADYRDLDARRFFDKIVSVGMIEHVGESHLQTYFQCAWKLLKPGGTMLNHGIAVSATFHRQGPSFIDRHVFPDGELAPISTTLRAAEQSGFEVRDVESLREHYASTLRQWVQRLETRAGEARRITSDTIYRTWRLYMAGSAYEFSRGRVNVYQSLLSKPVNGVSGLPLSRDDWYRS